MNDHIEIQEAIAAYVTHSIDPQERAHTEHELLEHLPGCPSCTALMRDLRELAGDLALVPDARPISEIAEARVMTAVTGSRPVAGVRARSGWPRAAAGAMALAIVASAVVNVVVVTRANHNDARTRAAISAMALVSDPRAQHAVLQGPSGSLTMSVLPTGKGVLIAQGLTQAPSGSVYELWLSQDTRYVPVRTFSPDGGDVVLPFNVSAGQYTGAAITVEQHYVTQPTRSPSWSGSLTA
jgi:hypothetical protein